MKEKIAILINESLDALGLKNISDQVSFLIEHPADLSNGDYSCNVALVLSKKVGQNPRELAEKIAQDAKGRNLFYEISDIVVAGPGFINFTLSKKFLVDSLNEIVHKGNHFGKNDQLKDKKIVVDYTDPNTFKQFHIGHLMSNSIGESLARIYEWNGAEVFRACYQSDVGMNVAKAIWGMKKKKNEFPQENADLSDKLKFVGMAYAYGDSQYVSDETTKAEINEINKQIYALHNGISSDDDGELKEYYEKGKQWSLKHFDEIYEKLGTKFDKFIFESQMANLGEKIVRENTGEDKIFELSNGAIIYKGEKEGLHTRVFINSLGLPTYEAKDIGLAHFKEKLGNFDVSIVITASEQKEYFRVMLNALSKIDRAISDKTIHITHGMMMLDSGKMSSRKGNVVTGESMIEEAEEMTTEKISDRGFNPEESRKIVTDVSVAAIKFAILKQATGHNIIYNPEEAVSFEGASGPYLQYTYTRAKSVTEKAVKEGIAVEHDLKYSSDVPVNNLERLLYRFPEIIEESLKNLAPHVIANYLLQVASEFNSFYAQEQIVDHNDTHHYKLTLTYAMMNVLKNGLYVLGIRTPDRM